MTMLMRYKLGVFSSQQSHNNLKLIEDDIIQWVKLVNPDLKQPTVRILRKYNSSKIVGIAGADICFENPEAAKQFISDVRNKKYVSEYGMNIYHLDDSRRTVEIDCGAWKEVEKSILEYKEQSQKNLQL